MADWESQKKALLPYLQRAAEIEAVDPKVAYYCRLYAVEQGIKIEQRDQRVDDLLELVLNQLEKDKPHLVLETTKDLDHCENFALNVYIKAKRRDEQGVSDRDTAKAYYAAFNFIEILKQFGPLSPEVDKERRFAVYRAAEIKKHLDEGTEPPALVPSGEKDTAPANAPDVSHKRVESLPLSRAPQLPTVLESCPAVDYDPGYILGSRVFVMDEDSGQIQKGAITSKATEVGGFFNVDIDGGAQRQLGALFLAPDLSEGGTVTYFFPDGRQMNGIVTQMQSTEWPPVYTLKLEDDSVLPVTHSQFVLNSPAIPTEGPEPTHDGAMTAPMPEWATSQPTEPEQELEPEPEAAGPALRKQESWIKWKDPSKKMQDLVPPPTAGDLPPAPVPPPSHVSPVIPDMPPRYPGMAKPLTPEDYYGEGFVEDVPAASPLIPVVNYDPIARAAAQPPPEPARRRVETFRPQAVEDSAAVYRPEPVHQSMASFKPEPAAVQQATKFTHQATAALNFSDVPHAIQCLQSALKCLTQPSESST